MKIKMLVETTVAGKVRKPDDVLELPVGLAQSLIRTGRARPMGKRKRENTAAKRSPEKATTEE